MSFFGDNHPTTQAYEEFEATPHEHKAKLSHEVIAGAAAYEAAKAYQAHCAKHGKPSSHEKAKEIFAGLAGFAVDRLIETKGLDALDKHKAKRAAEAHANETLADHY